MNKKTTLIIAIAVGLAVCGLGIYLNFFQTKGFAVTGAEIVGIEETYMGTDADGHEEYSYDVTISYSVNGTSYRGKLDTYSSNYEVGKRVRIYYDPQNPEVIHGDNKLIAKILIFVGPAVSALAVYGLVSESKKKSGSAPD